MHTTEGIPQSWSCMVQNLITWKLMLWFCKLSQFQSWELCAVREAFPKTWNLHSPLSQLNTAPPDAVQYASSKTEIKCSTSLNFPRLGLYEIIINLHKMVYNSLRESDKFVLSMYGERCWIISVLTKGWYLKPNLMHLLRFSLSAL